MLSFPEFTLSEIRLSTTTLEVLPDGAADAAVHHLDDLRLSLLAGVLPKQRVVDANLG